MLIKHYFTNKIAHSSYILAGQITCAVIDPLQDVYIYLRKARAMGVDIFHILKTHLQAAFIYGHLDLGSIRIYLRLKKLGFVLVKGENNE